MDRQRVTIAALLAILPFAHDLPAQEVIDLPGRDRPLDADFEEIFRVGVREGEDWEMFANVSAAAFDADGNLYIVDGLYYGMDTRIVVFDASGNFVREFGSMGEGPGEFNMPTAVAVMRDGTTVVEDLRHRCRVPCGAWIWAVTRRATTPLSKGGWRLAAKSRTCRVRPVSEGPHL